MKKVAAYGLFVLWAGLFLFTISSCQKEVSEENGKTTASAEGSLKDSLGNCLPISVVGTYYNGVVPGADTAYVQVEVNVTTIGNYNISSDLQNGFSFSDSGFFSATGINVIRLKPGGSPILNVTTNFNISFDSSVCSFSIDVQDSTGKGLGGNGGGDTVTVPENSWRLTDSTNGKDFSGSLSGNFSTLVNQLALTGYASTTDSVLIIGLILPNSVIDTGTFVTGISNNFSFSDIGPSPAVSIYYADGTTGDDQLTIKIVSYDSGTKVVKGIFSGKVHDGAGNTITITHGEFNTVVN